MLQQWSNRWWAALGAIAAGVSGGLASQFLPAPAVVHAQTLWSGPPQLPELPKRELITDRFAIVDRDGHVRGEMKVDGDSPEIVLYGSRGQVIWKAPPSPPHPVY